MNKLDNVESKDALQNLLVVYLSTALCLLSCTIILYKVVPSMLARAKQEEPVPGSSQSQLRLPAMPGHPVDFGAEVRPAVSEQR